MNRTHQEIDARTLAMHRMIAEKIKRDPSLFEKPSVVIARWRNKVCGSSLPYLLEWERLIGQGMNACLSVATEESEYATALRQSSPFVGILTEKERLSFLKSWSGSRAKVSHAP